MANRRHRREEEARRAVRQVPGLVAEVARLREQNAELATKCAEERARATDADAARAAAEKDLAACGREQERLVESALANDQKLKAEVAKLQEHLLESGDLYTAALSQLEAERAEVVRLSALVSRLEIDNREVKKLRRRLMRAHEAASARDAQRVRNQQVRSSVL